MDQHLICSCLVVKQENSTLTHATCSTTYMFTICLVLNILTIWQNYFRWSKSREAGGPPSLLDRLPYAAFGPTEIDSEISGGYPNKDLATCKHMPNGVRNTNSLYKFWYVLYCHGQSSCLWKMWIWQDVIMVSTIITMHMY